MSQPPSPREVAAAVHTKITDAMVAADTATMDSLMTADCTLTHMTGYQQSKAQWFAAIHDGSMAYHGWKDRDVVVEIHDDGRASVDARMFLEATIEGFRNDWRLRIRADLVPTTVGGFLAQRMVASIW